MPENPSPWPEDTTGPLAGKTPHQVWAMAAEWGQRMLIGELIEQHEGDKLDFLKRLMTVANQQDTPEWKAYGEGVRHALNIITFRGVPQEAYNGIINSGMPKLEVPKFPGYFPHKQL